jgi:hypothetical protein
MRALKFITALCAVVSLSSCQGSQPGGQAREILSLDEQPIEHENAIHAAAFRRRPERADMEVMDVSAQGPVLLGEPLSVPPNGTFLLRFRPTLVDGNGRDVPISLPDTIQDARFSPDGRFLAVLDGHGELSRMDLDSGQTQGIDRRVFPGFAFASDGRLLAYSMGDEPMLDAYLHDFASGTSRRLTWVPQPTWGFAFSPDDRTLLFVHSPFGFSSLYALDVGGGEPRAITNVGVTLADVRAGAALAPIPDGRKPPVWLEGIVLFESSRGVHGIAADGSVVWEKPGASRLFRASENTVHYAVAGEAHALRVKVSP